MAFELGFYSFGEITTDPETGRLPDPADRLHEVLEQAVLADAVGLDVFGAGEHHRFDFTISSPAVVLAAVAARTKRIKLTSAVNVLSSDDPVRIFQQFATLDLISKGRAEIIAGRGSYTQSFPLFGYDLEDYSDLFAEKLVLLQQVIAENPVSWQGEWRPSLESADIAPRPYRDRKLPLSVAVGGTPASVVRAASRNLPLALAVIGGAWANFKPFVDLYRQSAEKFGHDTSKLPVSVNGIGFVAQTRQEAYDIGYPHLAAGMKENFHDRDHGINMTRQSFEAQSGRAGALYFGSTDDIIQKILDQHTVFGHQRTMLHLGFGSVPAEEMKKSIRLLGEVVAPAVREEIAKRENKRR